jgi:signal transduction histidine kinase
MRATTQLVVAYHYDAGQTIVSRGQKLDSRIQTTLKRLAETTAATTPVPAPAAAKTELAPVVAPVAPVASKAPLNWFWWAGSSAALLLIAGAVVVAVTRKSRRPGPLSALQPASQVALPPELAPQLVQILRTAVVQELAAQRQELLQTQHIAAAEVVRLMQRLNELHAPLQDRLSAYEHRIQELETELTVRKEENRELLKLKIDLLRQQLESERVVGRRSGFN